MEFKTLYRPVGLNEALLIMNSGWKAFPPRLEWQPIFYPVMNQAYAEQIAGEWNTKDEFSGYCGIVTKFKIKQAHFKKFKIENVGGEIHNELWVPAEELDLFNQNIEGLIEIVNVFFDDKFLMPESEEMQAVLKKFK